jgi:hypothetical protein
MQVPDQPRNLRLHPYQWVGLPLIILVPLLALLNIFGETRDYAEDTASEIALRVEYPSRYRFKQLESVHVLVENVSATYVDTLVVAFDPEYVRQFSTPTFIPTPTEPFEIEILAVEPGEIRRVWAELQGEQYGRHDGTIEAYRQGSLDTARVFLSTFVFP